MRFFQVLVIRLYCLIKFREWKVIIGLKHYGQTKQNTISYGYYGFQCPRLLDDVNFRRLKGDKWISFAEFPSHFKDNTPEEAPSYEYEVRYDHTGAKYLEIIEK